MKFSKSLLNQKVIFSWTNSLFKDYKNLRKCLMKLVKESKTLRKLKKLLMKPDYNILLLPKDVLLFSSLFVILLKLIRCINSHFNGIEHFSVRFKQKYQKTRNLKVKSKDKIESENLLVISLKVYMKMFVDLFSKDISSFSHSC